MTVRALALQALNRIEEGGAYGNLLVKQMGKNDSIDSRDRRLMTSIIYGTLQHRRLLDFYLHPFLSRPMDKQKIWLANLLRMSAYQICFFDKVPNHAVVHEAVELAKKHGNRGVVKMVNGVLRNFLRKKRRSLHTIHDAHERLAIETSHPTWMVTRWVKQFGYKTTRALCNANNQHAPVTIRVNTLKTTVHDLIYQMENNGFQIRSTPVMPECLFVSGGDIVNNEWYEQGLYTVQDVSSMSIVPYLQVAPGMRVLDACAAPGGKTTHIAEHMQNEGYIQANDIHAHKETLIREQAARLGIRIVETSVGDARLFAQTHPTARYDRILIDAPCSGFGVIRRKPDIKWKKRESDIKEIATVQYELLEYLAPLLNKNGRLVYSTCTWEREETERIVNRYVQNNPKWQKQLSCYMLPHQVDGDGFYVAVLTHNSE